MSKDSLLKSLSKYPRREGGDPRENFLTEAFAWLLRSDCGFSDFFLDKVRGALREEAYQPQLKSNQTDWKTQVWLDGKYPDMVLADEYEAFLFEHKVWSSLHENEEETQIGSYRTRAEKKWPGKHCIILITAGRYQHAQEPDAALCWSDVHGWIDEWLVANDNCEAGEHNMLQDFQDFLEHENLGPSAPISHSAIRSYFLTRDFESQVGRLLNSGLEKRIVDLVGFDDISSRITHRWGRFGVDIWHNEDEDWLPGVFVGFMLDGKDHEVKPLDEVKGPDCSIIIDFPKSLHNIYPENPFYKNLVARMQRELPDYSDWLFYDHLNDKTVKNKNRWHPLHIRKPMFDVFRGTKTADEQVARFYKEVEPVLRLLFADGEIKNMRSVFGMHSKTGAGN